MCCSQHHGLTSIHVPKCPKWHRHVLCVHADIVQSLPAQPNAAHVDIKTAQGIERADGRRDDVNFPLLVKIFNLEGRLLRSSLINQFSPELDIDFSGLPPNMYLMNLRSSNAELNFKVVKSGE